jgi:hypothetical protein
MDYQKKHLFRISLFALSKHTDRRTGQKVSKYEAGIATDEALAKDLANTYWKQYDGAVWDKEVRIVNDERELIYQHFSNVQPPAKAGKAGEEEAQTPEKIAHQTKGGTHKAQKQKAGKAGKGVS